MKLSSEEKLLKIIEGPAGKKNKSLFPLHKAGRGPRGGFFRSDFWTKKTLLKLLTLKNLNRSILAFAVIATVFLIGDFSLRRTGLTDRVAKIEQTKDRRGLLTKTDDKFQVSLTESLYEAKKRSIFSFTAVEEVEETKGNTDSESVVTQDVLEGYVLVGVIWSNVNPQVMIEDAKGKTYLLATGDTLDLLTVKEIYKDQVIFSQDNHEWTLR